MSIVSSVIIGTFNRAYLLKRTLQALARQTMRHEQFEVIVVDDGSQDETALLCEAMSRELSNLRCLFRGENNGLASACNLGIKAARGEYVLFTDDDCIPDEKWVESLSRALERKQIVAGAVASPVSQYIKLCHNISQFHPFMLGRKACQVDFIAGANMGFRKSVLEDLNGFKEDSAGAPDTELVIRSRLREFHVYFTPDAVVTHDPDRTTLSEVFSYSSAHASSTILLRNHYCEFLRTPFILKSPALILLTAPLIATKVTLQIYLGNVSLIKRFWTAPLVFGLKLAWCWGAARGLWTHKQSGMKH